MQLKLIKMLKFNPRVLILKDSVLFQSNLTCSYLSHKPQFFIAPIKVEVLSLEPYIVIYYEVITENQANYLKNYFNSSMVFMISLICDFLRNHKLSLSVSWDTE